MSTKKKVIPRFDAYRIVMDAVEEGVVLGLFLAFTHEKNPMTDAQSERLRETMHQTISDSLCEVMDFDRR